jgi:hypothetical protein
MGPGCDEELIGIASCICGTIAASEYTSAGSFSGKMMHLGTVREASATEASRIPPRLSRPFTSAA